MQHPMETGFRRELDGSVVPMNIIEKIACHYAGREVFRSFTRIDLAQASPPLWSYVWLDEADNFFASVSTWGSTIREGWEPTTPTLVNIQDSIDANRSLKLPMPVAPVCTNAPSNAFRPCSSMVKPS